MGKLYRLEGYKRSTRQSHPPTVFDRSEINLLLSLYSRRVMSGEWRDYAIDQGAGLAVFSVYRHSQERPIFTIAKRQSAAERRREYLVCRGAERLARAPSLAEALTIFQDRFRVVS